MMTPVKRGISIRPAEFYGNGLPRPRFFDNPKFNSHRVDPPLSVLDPLLSWAREAHWSMGGLNFTRLRLQGRIEGNVNKLRAQLEQSSPIKFESASLEKKKKKRSADDSPPAAPVAVKRRRYLDLNDSDLDDEEEIGSEDEGVAKIRRKLSDDFDRVAEESKTKLVKANNKPIESEKILKEKKKKKKTQKVEETTTSTTTRTSPRLAKRRST